MAQILRPPGACDCSGGRIRVRALKAVVGKSGRDLRGFPATDAGTTSTAWSCRKRRGPIQEAAGGFSSACERQESVQKVCSCGFPSPAAMSITLGAYATVALL